MTITEALAIAQGFYFFLTGIWPIIDIRSFQKVTGPKSDLWLVKTVGALISVVGGVLLAAGFGSGVTFEIFLLAVGSASALTLVDVIYVTNGTIAKIYLLDAAAEIILITFWLVLYALNPASV